MRKLKNMLVLPLILMSLASCNNQVDSSSQVELKTDLQKIFYKLKSNNFTYNLEKYHNYEFTTTYSSYYYTSYSFQMEEDNTKRGVAQKEDYIFEYTYSDNTITPSTPKVNTSTGVRYSSIYEFTTSFENIDLESLPDTLDESGYYNYTFGENTNNDKLIMPILFRLDAASIPPKSLKMKVIGNNLEIQGESGSSTYQFKGYISDIDSTENTLIKNYLDEGKDALFPIDKRFFKFINPYFFSHNYTIDMDATKFKSNGTFSQFKMTEYSTDNAIYDELKYNTYSKTGYFYYLGAVHQFSYENNEFNITSTPQADSDGNFYDSIYDGDYPCLSYTLTDLSFSNISGYISPNDEDTYVITDSQFCYYLGSTVLLSQSDECYYKQVEIKIVNDDTHEFMATFKPYNKSTGEEYGEYSARFYNLNNTKIDIVDKYTYLGDEPSEDKTTLKEALDLFKTNNYSMDILSSVGLTKVYFSENYMYQEAYGNSSNNAGFMKIKDSIYEFSVSNNQVNIDSSTDYATKGMELPGVGSYFQADDDASYFSCFNKDDMYNLDNYTIANVSGLNIYKNTASNFSAKFNSYLYGSSYTNYVLPNGTGFVASKDGDNYHLSLINGILSTDGTQQGYVSFTFYDLEKTSYSIIDEYINSLN